MVLCKVVEVEVHPTFEVEFLQSDKRGEFGEWRMEVRLSSNIPHLMTFGIFPPSQTVQNNLIIRNAF
jgi:hypothetical protein